MKILVWPTFSNTYGNPLNRILYTHIKLLGWEIRELNNLLALLTRYSIWHIHWPEAIISGNVRWKSIIKSILLLVLIIIMKLRGTKIVWTVHNIATHDISHSAYEQYFWRAFISLVDGYINLSNVGKEIILSNYERLSTVSNTVIPHGHYRGIYLNEKCRSECRSIFQFNEEEVVLLYFGSIWEYKNVPKLISEFNKLDIENVSLLIAGKPHSKEIEEKISIEAGQNKKVHLFLEYIAEDSVQDFFNAADIIVLPFLEILNSGSALLALSFNKPVLVPEMGALGELRDEIGSDWVQTYIGELHVDYLLNVINNLQLKGEVQLDKFDWENIARRTIDFYNRMLQD